MTRHAAADERLIERIWVTSEDVPPDRALAGDDPDAGARRARADRAADKRDDWRRKVRELVFADGRRVVRIAALDRPGVAAGLQIPQRAIDAAGVKFVPALGAAQLELHRAEARAGLQPGDANVGLDLSERVEPRGFCGDGLRGRADLQRALLRGSGGSPGATRRAGSAPPAWDYFAIVTGVSPTMMAASPRSSLSSAR